MMNCALPDRKHPSILPGERLDIWARIGDSLQHHQRTIRTVQWTVVAVYIVLLVVPALLPLPSNAAYLWTNFTRFAQFIFWGIWWPFVILATALVGRVWCGLFCPEGTITEFASSLGKGKATPQWITWPAWHTIAFASTTVYGQMVSVYQYARPTLLILGGSTVAAAIVGYLYGRNKCVWCRYLCPVGGVFSLLAKLAPLHFRVDPEQWRISELAGSKPGPVNCPHSCRSRRCVVGLLAICAAGTAAFVAPSAWHGVRRTMRSCMSRGRRRSHGKPYLSSSACWVWSSVHSNGLPARGSSLPSNGPRKT